VRLQGKTAFITGGTSGIGLATAKAFIREGAEVHITGRDRKRLDEAVSGIGGTVSGHVADATDDAAVAEALMAAAQASGGLDVIFANVGLYVDASLGTTTRDVFTRSFASGATAAYMTIQSALPHLRDGASVIVNGSTYATMGQPGSAAYAASKGAVTAMAKVMASELAARRIRVNVVVPGAVDTPSWGMDGLDATVRDEQKKRLGERALFSKMLTAGEVANVVSFLASDESSGINAAEIFVDGGTTGAMAGSPRFRKGE